MAYWMCVHPVTREVIRGKTDGAMPPLWALHPGRTGERLLFTSNSWKIVDRALDRFREELGKCYLPVMPAVTAVYVCSVETYEEREHLDTVYGRIPVHVVLARRNQVPNKETTDWRQLRLQLYFRVAETSAGGVPEGYSPLLRPREATRLKRMRDIQSRALEVQAEQGGAVEPLASRPGYDAARQHARAAAREKTVKGPKKW